MGDILDDARLEMADRSKETPEVRAWLDKAMEAIRVALREQGYE